MPFVLIIVGVVFLDAAVRNTVSDSSSGPGLTTLLKGDFTGKDNFLYWITAIFIIGAIGYIKPLQPVSRMFMALVVLVLFLSNGGFFSKAYGELFGTDKSGTGIQPNSMGGIGSSTPSEVSQLEQSFAQSGGV